MDYAQHIAYTRAIGREERKNIPMNKTNINAEKTYSVLELYKLGAFKGIKDYRTCVRHVLNDAAKGRTSLLKPTILGEGRAKRIYIKGANFTEYAKSLTS